MARINNKGQLSGTVGPYAYRVANGKAIVQSKPGKNGVRQTTATQSSASAFGTANSSAKKLRSALFPLLLHLADPRMHNRFAVKVHQAVLGDTQSEKGRQSLAMGDLTQLQDFAFNSHSPFEKYAGFEPQVQLLPSGQLQLTLPAFPAREQLRMPDSATDCSICLLVAALDPAELTPSYIELFKADLSRTTTTVPQQQWTTPVLPTNHLIVAGIALLYYQDHPLMGKITLNSRELHPGKLIGVFRNGGG